MVTIYLCDDNQQMRDKYSSLIYRFAYENRIAITLSIFESGEELMFHLYDDPNQVEIIYLDVLMGELNGMEAAKQLRQLGCKAEIIFITTCEDYVYEAFDTSPMQYLIKDSTSDERFEEIFLRAVSLTMEKNTKMFVCESSNVRKVIPIKDISYFEIWKRLIRVHDQGGEIFEYYGTMEQLEQQMVNKDFVRVHRSYMVNLQYIGKFQRSNLFLKTGDVIPIGVTYMKLVDRAFSDYISTHNIYK